MGMMLRSPPLVICFIIWWIVGAAYSLDVIKIQIGFYIIKVQNRSHAHLNAYYLFHELVA